MGAVTPFVNRIDPDEHAIERGELCAYSVEDIVLVDHWFGIDADFGQCREDSLESAGLWRGTAARRLIPPRQNSEPAKARCGRLNGDESPLADGHLPLGTQRP